MPKTNLYYKKGKRFLKVKNLEGYYYNSDESFTETRQENSIGIVLLHSVSEILICSLDLTEPVNWKTAKILASEQFNGKGHLPELNELLFIRRQKALFKDNSSIWSNTEYSSSRAWYLRLRLYGRFVSCRRSTKGRDRSVLAFTKIKI